MVLTLLLSRYSEKVTQCAERLWLALLPNRREMRISCAKHAILFERWHLAYLQYGVAHPPAIENNLKGREYCKCAELGIAVLMASAGAKKSVCKRKNLKFTLLLTEMCLRRSVIVNCSCHTVNLFLERSHAEHSFVDRDVVLERSSAHYC